LVTGGVGILNAVLDHDRSRPDTSQGRAVCGRAVPGCCRPDGSVLHMCLDVRANSGTCDKKHFWLTRSDRKGANALLSRVWSVIILINFWTVSLLIFLIASRGHPKGWGKPIVTVVTR
jgi:hypothetical protein